MNLNDNIIGLNINRNAGPKLNVAIGVKPLMGPPKPFRAKRNKVVSPSSTKIAWGKTQQSVSNSSALQSDCSTSKTSSADEGRIILALTEGRGEARCEIGLAVLNITMPHLILCQISDSQSYVNVLTKINVFSPSEILVPKTFMETTYANRLVQKIKECFPNITITSVPRNMFNKAQGLETIQGLCIASYNSIILVLQHRYYALAAAAALIRHIQTNLYIFYASGSVKVEYQESEGYALIDVATADRLELVSCAHPMQSGKYSTLFSILNHCYTKIGGRVLRSTILQPPCDINFIEERLDCVSQLVKNPEKLVCVQMLLQKVSNIDQILSLSTMIPQDPQQCSNRQLNYMLLLNNIVDLIMPLKELIADFPQPFYQNVCDTLGQAAFNTIKEKVESMINKSSTATTGYNGIMHRCFAIKPGLNGLLDLVRKVFTEHLEKMKGYVIELGEKYSLPLSLSNNCTKGYHIVCSINKKQRNFVKKSDFPEEFIQVYRLAGSFTMKTIDLINMSTRIDDIMADILKLSNVMVHKTLSELKQYMDLFYKLCEQISILDMIQSLAQASLGYIYVRPTFSNFTDVQFAHHPLLEFLCSDRPVANSIEASEDFNMHIITGPNGAGKSIYIRQVMLLQIMAQIGCYVPANKAIFRPADKMVARIYLEDNMECGASAFTLEIKEIQYILNTLTHNSLIIIDELCRSTSAEEGTALAMAICEKLANTSAFVYLTTHYTLITKLADIYLNIKTWQMETLHEGESFKTIKFTYKYNVQPGVTEVPRYGVYLAQNIWPENVMKIVYQFLDNRQTESRKANINKIDSKIRLKYQLESDLKKLKALGKLTQPECNKYLNKYFNDLAKQNTSISLDESVTSNNVMAVENEDFRRTIEIMAPSEVNSSYQRISDFLEENPDNVNMLEPDISISTMNDSFSQNTSNKNPVQHDMSTSYQCNEDVNYENVNISLSQAAHNFSQSQQELISQIDNFNDEQLVERFSFKVPDKPVSRNMSQDSLVSSRSRSEQSVDEIMFSVTLSNDIRKTSTPIPQESPKLNMSHTKQESDVFDDETSMILASFTDEELIKKAEKHNPQIRHVFPEVIVKQGPNDVSMASYGSEDNLKSIWKTNVERPIDNIQDKSDTKKITIFGDIEINVLNSCPRKENAVKNLRKNISYTSELHSQRSFESQSLNNVSQKLNSYNNENQSLEKSITQNDSDVKSQNSQKSHELTCSPMNEQNIARKSFDESFKSQINDDLIINNLDKSKVPEDSFNVSLCQVEKNTTNTSLSPQKSPTKTTKDDIPNTSIVSSQSLLSYSKSKKPKVAKRKSFVPLSSETTFNEDQSFAAFEKKYEKKANIGPIKEMVQKALHDFRIKKQVENAIDNIETVKNLKEDGFITNEMAKTEKYVPEIIEKLTSKESVKSSIKIQIDNILKSQENECDNLVDKNESKENDNDEIDILKNVNTKNNDLPIKEKKTKFKKSTFNIKKIKSNFRKLNKGTDLQQSLEFSDKFNKDCKEEALKNNNTEFAVEKELPNDNNTEFTVENKPQVTVAETESNPKNDSNNKSNTEENTKSDSTKIGLNVSNLLQTSDSSKEKEKNTFDLDIVKSNFYHNQKMKSLQKFESNESMTTTLTESVIDFGNTTITEKSSSKEGNSTKMNNLYKDISQVSKKRNLEEASSSLSDSKRTKLNDISSETVLSQNMKKQEQMSIAVRKKFRKPRKSDSSDTVSTISKRLPAKLTKSEIQRQFDDQDRFLLDQSSTSSDQYSKYLEQRLNRPSVREVQEIQHLALVRKTGQGPVVIPFAERKKRKKNLPQIPLISQKDTTFNVAMFSDKNALEMDKFLNSNEKDCTKFNFDLTYNEKTEFSVIGESLAVKKAFNFEASKKLDFQRTISFSELFDAKEKASQISENAAFVFSGVQNSSVATLTPQGYFKRNKSEIEDIMNRYLNVSENKTPCRSVAERPKSGLFESSLSFDF